MLSLHGELDAASVKPFTSTALAIDIIEQQGTSLRIDPSQVSFIDCAGWRSVEHLKHTLVVNLSPAVQRLLDLIEPKRTARTCAGR